MQLEQQQNNNKINNKKLDSVKIKVARLSELNKLVVSFQDEILKLNEQSNNMNINISSLNIELNEQKKYIDKLKLSVDFFDKNEIEKKLIDLENELNEMNKKYDICNKFNQEYNTKVEVLQAKKSQYIKQLENGIKYDIDKLTVINLNLEKDKMINLDNLGLMKSRIDQNTRTVKNILVKSNMLLESEKKYMTISSLSNTVNGNISKKEKIMLETYIQMKFFDKIIARANTRFMIMTSGQYELKRKISSDNNRRQSGLELDVIDHYNGTERSVKTLSGGESFKASLALALGLSDEIQYSSGGIKIDTMFVDEGFGSLDENSLKQAVDTLSDLTLGNRLIGIISHVDQLKEKIDKQIIIKKSNSNGSYIKIIN